MSKARVGTTVILLFLVAMSLTGLASYRRLAALDARAEEAWQVVRAASEADKEAAEAAFNEVTLEYNRARRRFPTILIAMAAGFPDRPYLDAPAKSGRASPPE